MSSKAFLAAAALVTLAITGCAPNLANSTTDLADPDAQIRNSGVSGTILTAEQLRYESGSILDVMTRHIVSMNVDKSYNCPSLGLRGINTSPGIIEPVIYVDGIKSVDTCILEMLTVHDVSRIEVYPSGISPHPGLFGNSRGLILVFTRR